MLKLLIADDEKRARETIARLIDWESMGVKVIGLCSDGISAYHMILDEMPEIVLTDIKMPGLSGLELIERISRTDSMTQFIILSGYGEFEYAKTAMRYGVKHFILKPCSEKQLVEEIREAIEEFYAMRESRRIAAASGKNELQSYIMKAIVMEGITSPSFVPGGYLSYQQYFDFTYTAYDLCCLYYLEEKNLEHCLEKFQCWIQEHMPGRMYYGIYVKNVLLIYIEALEGKEKELDIFWKSVNFADASVSPEYQRKHYDNLSGLLDELIIKTKRYEVIYYISHSEILRTYNHGLVAAISEKVKALVNVDFTKAEKILDELKILISGFHNLEFVRQSLSNMLVQCAMSEKMTITLPILMETLGHIKEKESSEEMTGYVFGVIEGFLDEKHKKREYSSVVETILEYVNGNYSYPDLNLKYIAENVLYMNADYVSRCFIKEMGIRFSQYLINVRIEKAKQLLSESSASKITWVAEQVGCGNNPHYFSYIFKKYTGFSPTEFQRHH